MTGADVELVLYSTSTAKSYYFRPIKGSGWASCTINDDTCELTIQSDWGDGADRWHAAGLGVPTLTEFIASADDDYLARKLLSCDRMECFDADATTRNLFRGIIALRRNGECSAERAREAWDALSDDYDLPGRDVSAYAVSVPVEVCNLLDVSEHMVYVPSAVARAFKGWILPALRAACKAEVERRAAPPPPALPPAEVAEARRLLARPTPQDRDQAVASAVAVLLAHAEGPREVLAPIIMALAAMTKRYTPTSSAQAPAGFTLQPVGARSGRPASVVTRTPKGTFFPLDVAMARELAAAYHAAADQAEQLDGVVDG